MIIYFEQVTTSHTYIVSQTTMEERKLKVQSAIFVTVTARRSQILNGGRHTSVMIIQRGEQMPQLFIHTGISKTGWFLVPPKSTTGEATILFQRRYMGPFGRTAELNYFLLWYNT